MTVSVLTAARRALTAFWLTLMVGLIALVAGMQLAPLTDRDVLIIRGRSMEPAVPLGSLVVVDHVRPAAVRAGDVVTIRLPNGIAVTHRVVRVVELPAGPHFELRGDANEAADANLVPGSALVGRVALHVPFAGYVMTMLSTPAGLISLLSLVGGLFVAIGLIEELEAAARSARRRPLAARTDLRA